MNEKLSLQNIVDTLSQNSGVSRKVADTYVKSFFDTIVEALYMGEEVIKVKGLGTFKLVDVESRESVNVTNGERIVIPGYKKVSFVPEDSVVDRLNVAVDQEEEEVAPVAVETVEQKKEEVAPVAVETVEQEKEEVASVAVETVEQQAIETVEQLEEEDTPDEGDNIEQQEASVEEEATLLTEDNIAVEEAPEMVDDFLLDMPEPENVEKPLDALSGIDMLISTPESVEDVRERYEAAKALADKAIEEARKANAEKLRLEMLLQRLEDNATPEVVEEKELEESSNTNDVTNSETTEEEIGSGSDEVTEKADEEAIEEPADTTVEEPTKDTAAEAAESPKSDEALERYLQSEMLIDEDEKKEKRFNIYLYCIFPLLLTCLVGCIVYFMYKTSQSIEEVERVPEVEQKLKAKEAEAQKLASPKPGEPKSTTEEKAKPATIEKAKSTTEKAEEMTKTKAEAKPAEKPAKEVAQPAKAEAKEAKPSVPKTYVMKPGDSLTRLSQRFYGTKDSVRAIIRVNSFPNPDNVPVGATINLP